MPGFTLQHVPAESHSVAQMGVLHIINISDNLGSISDHLSVTKYVQAITDVVIKKAIKDIVEPSISVSDSLSTLKIPGNIFFDVFMPKTMVIEQWL